MGRVFLKALKSHRTPLLFITLGVMSLDLVVPASFELASPMFQDVFQSAVFSSLLKTGGEFSLAAAAQAYVSVGYTHPIYIVLPAAFAIGAASGAIGGEIERGTILLLLTRPMARYKLLLAKWAEILFGLAVVLAGGFLGLVVGVRLAGIEGQVQVSGFALASINAYLLFFAIGCFALLISSLSSNAHRPISVSAGVTLLSFFIDFLSTIWDRAEFLGPLSIFHYYQPARVARAGALSWGDLAVLAGVGLACLVAALVIFQRRDIKR